MENGLFQKHRSGFSSLVDIGIFNYDYAQGTWARGSHFHRSANLVYVIFETCRFATTYFSMYDSVAFRVLTSVAMRRFVMPLVASATRSPYSHDLIADLWSDPTVAVHGTDFKVNSQSRCGSDPSRAYASICKATPAPWVPMACDREMETQEKGKPCNRRKLVRRRYCAGGLRGYLPTPPLKTVDNFDSQNGVRPDRWPWKSGTTTSSALSESPESSECNRRIADQWHQNWGSYEQDESARDAEECTEMVGYVCSPVV
ncbi:hypothetical protein J7T55_012985 [Diaporthe amygdali]|uniref:uncharacterized protein n=1 Tax=Phomopsis amygdali TaxID=1214568 RepID=UPI0022FE06B8|nr:uncharacterized protein J7T55_012985 [Diaporthe amygdali]KAJ0118731.1 hypothetical protein J7T55_012985 [Diaporthe amygdali]